MSESPRTASNVLVIEDDIPMRRFLRAALQNEGHQVFEAGTAREGMTMILGHPPDLILLDLGLPDADGLTILSRVREWSQVPVVILSARGQESDKVDALNAGADDYLTKPFSVGELLARIRVALRHVAETAAGTAKPVFSVGELRADLAGRRIFVGDAEVHLTPTEYRLLAILIKYAGRVVTHRQLLREVWGPPYTEHTQYLRNFMGQLRQKLEPDPAKPRFIINEPGIGYRLKVD